MKFIKNMIQRIFREDKKILGRWNIETCNIKLNNKIDLSNEDHCGPCGQYILDKTKLDVTPLECKTLQVNPQTPTKHHGRCGVFTVVITPTINKRYK